MSFPCSKFFNEAYFPIVVNILAPTHFLTLSLILLSFYTAHWFCLPSKQVIYFPVLGFPLYKTFLSNRRGGLYRSRVKGFPKLSTLALSPLFSMTSLA